MNRVLIRAVNLRKTFKDRRKGTVEAVKDVSFEAVAGEIFGLLGPNGAGKTTTLRMLATILQPTSGTAEIAGFDVRKNPDEARRSLGFLSGDTGLYARLSAREMISYFGSLYGLNGDKLREKVEAIGRKFDMASFFHRRCAKLSTGQKQKVSISRTVIHDPPVLILDEPTAGLDVLAGRNIIDFIRSSRDEGKCVVLSTHDMGEAERLCDRIAIIHDGVIAAVGTKDQLFAQYEAHDLEAAFLRAVQE